MTLEVARAILTVRSDATLRRRFDHTAVGLDVFSKRIARLRRAEFGARARFEPLSR